MDSREPLGALVVAVDGASRGNPGPAAAGIVIALPDGTPLRQMGIALGRKTNNEAEYLALLRALQEVQRLRPTAVTVRMDSQLVVNQMTGRWRVRDGRLRLLKEQVDAVLAALPRVDFEWNPRELNSLADQLANAALGGEPTLRRSSE
ncbi:MAG: ribonuclease HI family protein [Chloroflexi bacterium]|nr:ribonuclease HI family protein [Chloroflexota bacterium]